MMKKWLLPLLCGGMIVLTACGGTEVKQTAGTAGEETVKEGTVAEETAKDTAEEAVQEEESEGFPVYEYPEKGSCLYEVYGYLIRETAKQYETADVTIPVVRIIAEDEEGLDGIAVYGDFFVYNYNAKGDTLLCVSGGDYPGVMHLKKTVDGYTVASFDVVEDGDGWTDSAKEIFGGRYQDFVDLMGDEEGEKKLRTQLIADYVSSNGLNISKYQDYGWDPVDLADTDGN